MKKFLSILAIVILFFSCQKQEKKSLESALKSLVSSQVDELNTALSVLSKNSKQLDLKNQLVKCRVLYKKIEPFVEYYFQGFSRRINGPALPDAKIDDNVVNDPTGFQVIEEIIFSEEDLDLKKLKQEIAILKTDLLFVKKNLNDLPVQNFHLYEILQHQIIRNATIGITGLDSPIAFQSIKETQYSLKGLTALVQLFCKIENQNKVQNLNKIFESNFKYLSTNNDFDSFNRLIFIKNFLMPLSSELEIVFKNHLTGMPNTQKAFSGTLSDLMQGKGLNADAFSPYATAQTDKNKIELGKKLFNDVNLSKKATISCSTCHLADKAFTDGKKVSTILVHSTGVSRNSPTLLYSGFQKSYFYDMRSQDLENQIGDVMNNKNEFNLSPSDIANRISKNENYKTIVDKLKLEKNELTPFYIRNAIAAYVRSLMPFNSKIDNYFKGKIKLTQQEENGFNLFSGKAKCATCHFIPLYNGTIPPLYNTSESEVIGVPSSMEWVKAFVDKDLGRYNTNQLEPFRHAFKTPTVRNIDKTAPYMHNGVYNTLEEIVKFYELGGGNGIGMNLENQTLPFDNLKLNTTEKQNIVLFLKTLTDKNDKY